MECGNLPLDGLAAAGHLARKRSCARDGGFQTEAVATTPDTGTPNAPRQSVASLSFSRSKNVVAVLFGREKASSCKAAESQKLNNYGILEPGLLLDGSLTSRSLTSRSSGLRGPLAQSWERSPSFAQSVDQQQRSGRCCLRCKPQVAHRLKCHAA